jgi:RNA polymerase sigma-70 factor (ECF subfamily)
VSTHATRLPDEVPLRLDASRRAEHRSDEELLDALRDDHTVALTVLLHRHWSSLVSYVDGFLHSRDAAEDVAQDTFVRLWERRKLWRHTGTVRALLYRIARNMALNESRSRRVRRNRRELISATTATRVATPAEALYENELRRKVEGAIAKLPERRREIFVHARYHNLSYAEIADILQISPQTVANQMSAALATLRESLRGVLSS